MKPVNARMRKSAYLLGRRDACEEFKRRGVVLLSAIYCRGSDGPWIMFLKTSATSRKSKCVKYRVRVTRKVEL